MADVCILVSLGRHPVSGRPRRAARDARAVELGLRLAGPGVRLVHAGRADEPGLRDYLGMGVETLTVLEIGAGDDPVPALVEHLRARPADLLLAGTRAEASDDSGLVPYLVAEGLGLPLVAAAAGLDIGAGAVHVHQALPRGQRRAFEAPLPALVTVDDAAPDARACAFARARRGTVETVAATRVPDSAPAGWTVGPARARPRRLRGSVAGTAEERLRAATQMVAGAGRVLRHPDPDEAARAIWDVVAAEGVVARQDDTEPTG